MRTRAYRPEVPGCLENRSLLSGVAGVSADPVILLQFKLNKVAELTRDYFVTFGERDRSVADLRVALIDVIVMIPFERVDGLGASINGILGRMQKDLSANVPDAVRTAGNDVIAATRAEVEARVQAGDVVVR
jgi:hypothetical protein